ncbi:MULTISPECIES: ATP12 family chaperone protein [Kordiimonas]|jgi:chaperone required for assembly of F1-ATPase|uniref:ATP12 family chaperone protein n=1 Tax=Kordiimonas TaxID=288021 RepID=UPI002580BE8C|nr:ATP12 family protein [Kordiimonas sp. UBA4487]
MKRFYENVATEAADTGHVITLDGRLVKTPAKATLVLPTRSLAEAVADEWRAQSDKIVPATMPKTQLAYTALDRVALRHDDVVREVAAFGATDLLCYRAAEPEDLVARQKEVWDPYLAWASETLGADLTVTDGIMPVAQDDEALKALMADVAGYDAFELTVLHAFTNVLGSLVLALAYMKGYSPLEAVWQASILDSLHQEELWGLDAEVEDKREAAYADLVTAGEFLSHLRNKTLETV